MSPAQPQLPAQSSANEYIVYQLREDWFDLSPSKLRKMNQSLGPVGSGLPKDSTQIGLSMEGSHYFRNENGLGARYTLVHI